jgi:hypothetical protein
MVSFAPLLVVLCMQDQIMRNTALSRLLVAGLAFGTVMTTAGAVQADIIDGHFDVSDLTGELSGENLSGSFSFDDSQSIFDDFTGFDLFKLTAFDFEINGTSFVLADLQPGPDSTDKVFGAAFFEGQFMGLEVFEKNNLFSILDDGFGSLFTYDLTYDLEDAAGTGDVTYTLKPGVSVPEPTSAVVLLTLGALGAGASLRRKHA